MGAAAAAAAEDLLDSIVMPCMGWKETTSNMNVLLSAAVQASDDNVAATSFHFRRAGLTRTKYVIDERRHQGCDEGIGIRR